MSRWELTNDPNWEAKITNKKGQVLVRPAGQRDEYPHATVQYDEKGNMVDYHWSDSRFGDRSGLNEIVSVALAFLRHQGTL